VTTVRYQVTLVTLSDASGLLSGLIQVDDAMMFPVQDETEGLVLTMPAEHKQIRFTAVVTNLPNVYHIRPMGDMRDLSALT
jgi:hypothetical protein